ncbi:MAG TPA: tripartite tricarboxylate transporter substrate binding protein [Burkholderiales bacterium]|jgi:tripartite-type tricarboxylate transporter receptor subunit TctC|nr:tripartite tricarboxylate transporter substrate binding protein [Burkholderiales bacterium]
MKRRIFNTLLAASLTALALVPAAAQAQAWPNRPIRVIISFTAGSSTDIVGRVVLQKVAEGWGQPVVFDNRGGAGGSIGANAVVTAQPDGYTLLVDSAAHSITPSMYAKLPYDTLKDFTDIAGLAIQPNVLVVPLSSPYKSVMDLVNGAKAKPGAINFASAGVGSGTHLNLEKFVNAAGIKVTHVPYKGTPEVLSNLLSGSVDAYWGPISATMAQVTGGKLRALAVSTPKRSSLLPDIPTTGEAGVANADAPLWFGVWGPKGLPHDITTKIAADVHKALTDPEVKSKLTALGNDVMDMSPEQFGKFVREEMVSYSKLIKAAGITPQ